MNKKLKDMFEKFIIKLLAPSTVCYRQLGRQHSEFRYWSWSLAKFVFKGEPVGKDGYYKRIYINNKRIKPWFIIPRHALIEMREKPKFVSIGLSILTASMIASLTTTFGVSTMLVIAGAVGALAIGAGVAIVGLGIASLVGQKTGGGGTGTPTYSSNDSPSLSGAKNDIASGVIPVSFGRCLQTFSYAQYATPLVNSGYSGNRYRVYCLPGYKNARYEDFRLGDVLLSNYRSAAYSLQQINGGSNFIGWDNAVTESINKELTFDTTQAIYQSAIAYYNQITSGSSVSITQTYNLQGVNLANWTNKIMDIKSTIVSSGADVEAVGQTTILSTDLVSDGTGGYNAIKTTVIDLSAYSMSEYRYTSTSPYSATRGNDFEVDLEITLVSESITINENTYTDTVNQGTNSYTGDKNEIISKSPTQTKFCDLHFSFPQGLYSLGTSGRRERVTIQAEVMWKHVGDTTWSNLSDSDITDIYTRDIDGVIQPLSSRINRYGNKLTFNTPDDINNADDKFFECVGLEFAEEGQYIVKILPVVFTKDNYWIGSINIADIIWRLNPNINVIEPSILPNVTQIAATFNATTQLDGEVDALAAIAVPYITNVETMELEQSRNPVDVIYYLLTDTESNPMPMRPEQIDIDSFRSARAWCEEHNCLCDGVISDEIKYETIIDEIANNNQLYFIPNKWGKAVLRVDTNEDMRPIKSFFNAENSWDLKITRQRGKLSRLLALRCSYIDEETWSNQEVTGYWYNNTCNWVPETGKDDSYYKPEKRDLHYIKNIDSVKRRIAYELEISNTKNTIAEFNVAREVLDLEVLDRVLVADYTRINDGISGTIESIIKDGDNVIGFKLDSPLTITNGMSITIRSVDISGTGANVNIYELKESSLNSSLIYLKNQININDNIVRGSGFYEVDNMEFYHSGDIYMIGTSDILSMVIKSIEEIKADDFTSKITCRLY